MGGAMDGRTVNATRTRVRTRQEPMRGRTMFRRTELQEARAKPRADADEGYVFFHTIVFDEDEWGREDG